jgi:hypothetical protein
MRILRPSCLLMAGLLILRAQGEAQSCLGSNSFANGRIALGAAASFADGFKRVGAVGAYGVARSWYANATVGTTSYDAPNSGSATDLGGSLGYQFGIGDSRAEVCPYGFAGYASYSGANTTNYGFGGGVGWRNDVSASLSIVPAVGLQWHGYSTAFKLSSYSGESLSSSTTEFWANVGFIASKNWSIVPGVMKSSQSGSKAAFVVTLEYYWAK